MLLFVVPFTYANQYTLNYTYAQTGNITTQGIINLTYDLNSMLTFATLEYRIGFNGSSPNSFNVSTRNYTIPASCINTSNTVKVQMRSEGAGSNTGSIYCMTDISSYQLIHTVTDTASLPSGTPTNPSLAFDGNFSSYTFYHKGWNTSPNTIDDGGFRLFDLKMWENISDYLYIGIKDPDGDYLPNTLSNFSNVTFFSYTNPVAVDTSLFYPDNKLTFCVNDINNQYTDSCFPIILNSSIYQQNVTMSPVFMELNFSNNINSFLVDRFGTICSNTTSTLRCPYHTSRGSILTAYFNLINDDDNSSYRQRYDFYRTTTPISESFLTPVTGWQLERRVKVLSVGKVPVQNAVVRVSMLNETQMNSLSNFNFTLTNQIITDSTGEFTFRSRRGMLVRFEVSADGYEDFSSSQIFTFEGLTDYITIGLIPSGSIDSSFLYHLPDYSLFSADKIYGGVLSSIVPNFTTNYASDLGLPYSPGVTNIYNSNNVLLQDNSYQISLEKGYHYDDSVANITVTLITSSGSINHTIIDLSKLNQTNLGTITDQTLSSSFLNPLLFIGLIFVAIFSQFVFKSATNTVGLNTFFIGSFLLSIISTAFLSLAICSALYYLAQPLKKIIGVSP